MSLPTKPPRPKTCRNPACAAKFTPQRLGQAVCSPKCGLAIKDVNKDKARKAIDQVERKQIRAAKERVKSRGDYAKEAQVAINRYVRLRDSGLGCVSCDKPASWAGQWHCSHFRSVGAAPHLRFNLLNMHKACSVCNNHLSGNIAGYRPRLIERIGQARVEWLESCQGRAGHDIAYLKRLKAIFTKKANRLQRRAGEAHSWIAM
ncbi:MAG TPA: recombination protein NinG [Pseudomonas sp.]|nr:recombination protein NinG [Pseudomonas sp.]